MKIRGCKELKKNNMLAKKAREACSALPLE